MRYGLVTCLAFLSFAVAASPAEAAGGINLAWNDCYGAGGVINKNFACNTNAGESDLYISFDPPSYMPDFVGSNPIIDLQSASALLPQWWQFKNAGSCRQTSLLAISTITGTCTDPWQGTAAPAIAAYYVTANLPGMPPNRARILGSVSTVVDPGIEITPGTEYFVLLVRIRNTGTVGTPCSGCSVPVCLVLNEVFLVALNPPNVTVTNPLANNFCTWQGGAIGGLGCPAATPTANRTWGQLKSIYR